MVLSLKLSPEDVAKIWKMYHLDTGILHNTVNFAGKAASEREDACAALGLSLGQLDPSPLGLLPL